MPMTLSDIRNNHPEYNDLSDDELAGKLRNKFYPDLSQEDFNRRVGYFPINTSVFVSKPQDVKQISNNLIGMLTQNKSAPPLGNIGSTLGKMGEISSRPLRDLAAGQADTARSLVSLIPGMPESIIQANPYEKLGVENMSWATPEGALQAIGQWTLPIPIVKGAQKGLGLLKKGADLIIPEKYTAKLANEISSNKFNPFKYSDKNVAKNIVNTRNVNYEKFSGQNGLYPNLFQDARNANMGNLNLKPSISSLDTIENFASPKYTENLKKFMQTGDIEDAHWAQSDLMKYVRSNKNFVNMPKPQQEAVKTAESLANKIKESMFSSGKNLDENLSNIFKKRYKEINTGYKEEVIPYTKNSAINSYIRGELPEDELLSKLSRGKFKAQVGKNHPELKLNRYITNNMPKDYKDWSLLAGGVGLLSAPYIGYKHYNSESDKF